MLMMGFFVILWVLKPPAGKDGEAVRALTDETAGDLRGGFGFEVDPRSSDPVDRARLRRMIPHAPKDGDKTSIEKKGTDGTEPEVQSIRPSKQVGMGVKVLFEPGEAKLSPEAKTALGVIAQEIIGHNNLFMVKGHASTDDYPDGTDDALKMNLALRRAQLAADYLVSIGVSRETLRVQGCSTYEPVVQRAYTGDAQSLNRRVEVESTGTLVKTLQGDSKSAVPKAPAAADHAEH